jgi:acetyl-CoA C-acetyltransferase
MKYKSPIYICSAKRTPIGSLQGALAEISSPELAGQLIQASLKETGIPSDSIDQVILGCVLSAGLGQAPARQATIKGGLSNKTNSLTINKVCSSGLMAIVLAANEIELGNANAVIAGGMENMSQSPYLLPKLRAGAKLGNVQAEDSIIKDGLWDVYNNFHMGNCAELLVKKYDLSREEQDRHALESYDRAASAIASGKFTSEIVPVKTKAGDISVDEEVGKLKREKVSQLKPVFEKDGSVTAANSSSISDGAAIVLVVSESYLKQHKLTPLAQIVASNTHSHEPELFGIAPVQAVKKVLKDIGEAPVDLFEINEAFSSVALACQKDLGIDSGKLNVNGGAVALGHPIGASGARIVVTLIHELLRRSGTRGIAAICNGGGEATSLVIERL